MEIQDVSEARRNSAGNEGIINSKPSERVAFFV
jgi:hypothetical protein